ncbi:MAG: exodeoxyribonuclease VII small subunit [Firmicutes bacterium]|nr:exodeoxyribonuclease VII small subunit [Candidatus Fermentithermobacillaceae bacterium]
MSANAGGAAGRSEAGGAFSFEQGLKRLEEIVQSLEKEDVPLEESLKLWEEGTALVRKLEEILDRAQARIEQVLRDEDGRIYTVPVEKEPG